VYKMNERIKELAYEAGLASEMQWSSSGNVLPYELEKFAKLIVQECAKIAEQTAGKFDPDIVAETVLMHFGAE